MNTPAHLIFGLAAFGRPGRRRVTAAAVAGGLAPDLSLYLMAGVSIWVMGIPARTVFRELYYSDAWQAVFAVDNSFPVWGLLLAIGLWRGWPALRAFAGAGLLHLAFDLPLHTHDARRHFWPLSDWRFESPVSYWDRAAHAGIVAPLELGASALLTGVILWRFRSAAVRIGALLLLAMEMSASGVWRFVF